MDEYEPDVTLFVPAYNEIDYVEKKVNNSFLLDYPKDKLHYLWVTDGSDDGTDKALEQYHDIRVLHHPERKGKIAAMNRGMKYVNTPIVIFTDANTHLSDNSIREIVRMFKDLKVGCVSGEKRIVEKDKDNITGSGEGIYWKYESKLKQWDAELSSVVGAAGELFAVRTELYEAIEPDTILDDFMISLRIVQRGYRIDYNPNAYAIESASINLREELKRKIRIAAGGIQSVLRLLPLLNPIQFGVFSFQYISHRVLRWTLTPLLLLFIIPLNLLLVISEFKTTPGIFSIFFSAQVLFYLGAFGGYVLEKRQIKNKIVFVPYYFCIMNYAVFMGIIRYFKKQQPVNWERAQRAK